MPRFTQLAILLLVAVALSLPSAEAWGCTGHMLVAEIAQRHLSRENRAKSDALSAVFADSGPFPRNPDMVQAACWPDDLKSWRQYAMKPWHYVDIPYNPENLTVVASPYVGLAVVDESGDIAAAAKGGRGSERMREEERLMSGAAVGPTYAIPSPAFERHVFTHVVEDDENGGNVVTAIRDMVVALKAHKVPIYSLTFAFTNLLHFVGDVHQPLHSTTRYSARHPHGDRGGNSVKVKVDGVETNLHSLWDNLCLSAKTHSLHRPLDDDDYDGVRLMADVLEDTYKFPADLLSESVASAMAWESHMFAINTSYPGVEDGQELTKAYLERCRATAEARVTLAGRRLGNMLNTILDDMNLTTVPGVRRAWLTNGKEHVKQQERDGQSDAPASALSWWRLW